MPQVPYTDETYKLPDRASAETGGLLNTPNYGAMVGRGLGQFGAGMGMLGNAASQMQQQNDHTAANNAMNDFREGTSHLQYGDPNTPDQPGYFSLQNKEALDAWKPTTDKVNQLRQSIMDGLSPAQQKIFQQQSDPFQTSAIASMAGHAAQQRKSYQNQTQRATLDNLSNQGAANLDNPAVFSQSLLQGRQTIAQDMSLNGIPLDSPIAQQRLQKFNDLYLSNASETAANNGDALKSKNILFANRKNISPDVFAQRIAALKPRLDHQVGNMLANGTINYQETGTSIPDTADQDATFAAMTHLESGGRQTDKNGGPITSPKGAIGVAQLMPQTAQEIAQTSGLGWDENRFKTDYAYNRALGESYYNQLSQKYGGNLTLAAAAYNAGPKHVDEWLHHIGDPRTGAISNQEFVQNIPFKETRDYISRAGASLTHTQPAASYIAPDINKQISDVHTRAQSIGASPEAENQALTRIHHNYSLWQATTHEARNQVESQVNDLSAAYMAGNTTHDIPEEQIRNLYPPDEAQKRIEGLTIQRNAGTAFSSLKWASPQQISHYAQDATMQRDGENIDHFKLRQRGTQLVLRNIANRNHALQQDPAAYASENPQVQQAFQNYQQNQTSENYQAYTDKLQAVQQNMGVSSPHILTNDEAGHIVGALTQADPQQQDIGPTLDAMKKHYGNTLWPHVLSELIDHKMPAGYASLADMDTPQQANAREVLQRNLRTKPEELDRMAGSAITQLKGDSTSDPIEESLQDVKPTYMLERGGVTKYNNLYDTMKLQTKGYLAKGIDMSQAISLAHNDLFGAKYDTSGYLRTPKGEMSATKQAGAAMLLSLKPEDINVSLPPAITSKQRAGEEILMNARDNGQWIANGDGSGYNMLIPSETTPGEWQVFQDKAGHPVTLKRDDIKTGTFNLHALLNAPAHVPFPYGMDQPFGRIY